MLNNFVSSLQSDGERPSGINRTTSCFDVQTTSLRLVLNAGSGLYTAHKLHPVFQRNVWKEIRVDIDPETSPDIVASITDMKSKLPAHRFDAIWSSHTLEHLYAHEVPLALTEFKRLLKPEGFALITLPDLEAIASLILTDGLDHVAYVAAAGPITPLDMLFGHVASVGRGRFYMAHKTGFTAASLGQHLIDAGFPTVLVKRQGLDLWALGLAEEADHEAIQDNLRSAGLDLSD